MQRAYVLHSVQENNILPLTSYCNAHCVFCSHLGNPTDLLTATIGMRSYEEIIEDIAFLKASRDVVIGESATPIIEGEPFLHPRVLDIIKAVRLELPATTIRITTNGTLLTEEIVRVISECGNVEINLSLNALTSDKHKLLMGNTISESALQNGFWFKKYQILWHGSVVAMPWITGWDELAKTIEYLDRNGASTARVFLPGFTSHSPAEIHFTSELDMELKHFVHKLRQDLKLPITLEPPMLDNLVPEIVGVMADTPADIAGLRSGDIVLSVNNKAIHSRVEAWTSIKNSKNPVVVISRNGEQLELVIVKAMKETSGLVCDYDFDWNRAKKIGAFSKKTVLMLTSEFAWPVVKAIPKLLGLEHIKVRAVKNCALGGSIACAGLLSVSDIISALETEDILPQLLLLPWEMFDYQGNDLFGKSYLDIEARFSIEVKLL